MTDFQLHTQRLLINNLTMNDAEAMFNYRSDNEVAKFQTWRPQSVKQTCAFITTYSSFKNLCVGQWNQVAIRLKPDCQLIGDSGLYLINDHEVEIGFTIAPEFQKNGYATEAVNTICQFLTDQTEAHTIHANTLAENSASGAVLRKAGFQQQPASATDEEYHFLLFRDSL